MDDELLEPIPPVCLVNDPVDVVQYLHLTVNTALSPEKELMLSILGGALEDLNNPKLRTGAKTWIFDPVDADWIFSFESICLHLDIESDYLKRGIRHWLKTHPLKTK